MSGHSEKLHVILAAHPTAGHTSALRAIGVELQGRGHPVGFALMQARIPFAKRWPEPIRFAAELPQSIASDGIEILPLRPAPSGIWHAARLPRSTGQDELAVAVELFTSGIAQQARHIADHVQHHGACIIVGDYLMPASFLAARLAGVPYVAMYHSALPFPADGAAPFGTALPTSAQGTDQWRAAEARLDALASRFDKRVSNAARALGLEPPEPGLLTRPVSNDLNLLATTPELEPGLRPLTGPVAWTGPCTRVTDPAGNLEDLAFDSDLPRAYISLGTVFNNNPRAYRTLIEGARDAGFQVIVSAGASHEELVSLQSDLVRIRRHVPQVALLKQVDVVITHGGNNTVQECLAEGRPMVVVPFGGDQWANARRVERLGVGVHLDPSSLTSSAVRRAVGHISQASVVQTSQALAASLVNYGGASAATDAILDLISARG